MAWTSGAGDTPPPGMFLAEDNHYYAPNPNTGQIERVVLLETGVTEGGMLAGKTYFASEAPPGAAAFPGPVTPGDFMYKFTKVGVPLGLAAMGGAAAGAALGGAGAAGAGAGAGGAEAAAGSAGFGATAGGAGAATGAASGGAGGGREVGPRRRGLWGFH